MWPLTWEVPWIYPNQPPTFTITRVRILTLLSKVLCEFLHFQEVLCIHSGPSGGQRPEHVRLQRQGHAAEEPGSRPSVSPCRKPVQSRAGRACFHGHCPALNAGLPLAARLLPKCLLTLPSEAAHVISRGAYFQSERV